MIPPVAKAVADQVRVVREKLGRGGALSLSGLEGISHAGWNANWPADERRQRDFVSFGMELLCVLNPQELRDFFTGFFLLPDRLWENFLSWRLSGVGNVWMGLVVWAQCIPKRFLPVMLVKSLPYIFPNLVLPFSTRGLPLKTESLYTEERWAPDGYSDFEQTPEMKRYFISSAPAPTSGPETEKGTDKGTATARTATKQVRLTTEGETTSVAKR
eukprot:FR736087.1.p1 GENE.FR736087.1~~FR736087.1.p1  ORF type:complete len:251 (+),score=11.45 FR736087.1:109-753(+)